MRLTLLISIALAATGLAAQPEWTELLAFSDGDLNCFVGQATTSIDLKGDDGIAARKSTESVLQSDRALSAQAYANAIHRARSFYRINESIEIIPDIQRRHSGYSQDGKWTSWVLIAISDSSVKSLRNQSEPRHSISKAALREKSVRQRLSSDQVGTQKPRTKDRTSTQKRFPYRK